MFLSGDINMIYTSAKIAPYNESQYSSILQNFNPAKLTTTQLYSMRDMGLIKWHSDGVGSGKGYWQITDKGLKVAKLSNRKNVTG